MLSLNGHFPERYQNVSILDFTGAKDDGSGEWWQLELYKTCKAPNQPPTNEHPVFYRSDTLPVAQTTMSEQCSRLILKNFHYQHRPITVEISSADVWVLSARIYCVVHKTQHRFTVTARCHCVETMRPGISFYTQEIRGIPIPRNVCQQGITTSKCVAQCVFGTEETEL